MNLVKPSYEILDALSDHILHRIELIGRVCYKSEERITDASCYEFVRNIMKRGHLSVIEHASFSVRFIVDRGVSHELVRHRLCAFSQESTRYCNYSGGVTFVIPPWEDFEAGLCHTSAGSPWLRHLFAAEAAYVTLLETESPQQARAVLPNSTKTEIVCTANLREWRHILTLRTSAAAHPQMQEIMKPLLAELQQLVPVIFEDI